MSGGSVILVYESAAVNVVMSLQAEAMGPDCDVYVTGLLRSDHRITAALHQTVDTNSAHNLAYLVWARSIEQVIGNLVVMELDRRVEEMNVFPQDYYFHYEPICLR